VPRGMPGFNDNLKNPPPDNTQSLTGNQSAATTLLKQVQSQCASDVAAGVTPKDWCPYIAATNPEPIVFYAGSSNQTRINILKAAVQQWNQVLGLNVTVKVDDKSWVACINGANTICQAWAIGWLADYPDPQDFLSLQFATGAPDNTTGFHNGDLDALFAKADKEQNPTVRMQEYNDAEQQMVNQCVWIPYAQDKLFWRQRSWVHGFGLNALQLIVDTDWAKVYITSH
jgi:oligopeptide transport system substrate-binding protein